MYNQGTVSVTTTATKIATMQKESGGVLIANQGSVTVYLGGSTVTANTAATGGFPLAANASVLVPTDGDESRDLYAIVASGTANVSFLQPAS